MSNTARSRARRSAGILMYRRENGVLAVLLVHPGGPFWAKKDDGVWSIPKGLCAVGEDELAAAKREFREETGAEVAGDFIPLGEFLQPSGKVVVAWVVEGSFDPAKLTSDTFQLEWPPRSGRFQQFPEVDRAAWFAPEVALRKVTKGQQPIIGRLLELFGTRAGTRVER
jgi:predicted NUDIX family NTP pyrophosphohydrolase